MREILFRGKRLDNGKWIEGDYQRQYDVFGKIRHLIYWTKDHLNWEYFDVDPSTVCQYTGLTDREGRKIFEGDILQENVEDVEETGTDKFIYSVIYSEEYTAFTTSDVVGEGYFEPLAEYASNDVEVIGNIFDNPDLIGE